MEQQTAKFEGWALVELFGHQREAGYVTTQYFGDRAMFQVDVPQVAARQETLERPRWVGDTLAPVGTVVESESIPGRTRLVSPGAVYAINPATEGAVRSAIAAGERREIKVISLPPNAGLPSSSSGDIAIKVDTYEPHEEEEEKEYPDGWNGDGR